MRDYLEPVGRLWRISSIVGCTAASIVCLVLSLLLWTDMIRGHSLAYDGRPLWLAAMVIGLIGLASAFIAWRLVCRAAAANGLTVMPAWFIQLLGVLLLLGLCFVAYHRGRTIFMVEGAFICLAMILVSRHLRVRQGLKPRHRRSGSTAPRHPGALRGGTDARKRTACRAAPNLSRAYSWGFR